MPPALVRAETIAQRRPRSER